MQLTTSKAKKKACAVFSKYIRTKYAKGNFVQCVTCGRTKEIKQMQAGHFIPGRHNVVLYDERNCHPQCYVCNVVLGSNGPKYYKFMLKKYGQKVIDDLERLDKQVKPMKAFEHLEFYDKYKKKLEKLDDN